MKQGLQSNSITKAWVFNIGVQPAQAPACHPGTGIAEQQLQVLSWFSERLVESPQYYVTIIHHPLNFKLGRIRVCVISECQLQYHSVVNTLLMTCPPVLQLSLQQMQEQGQILLEGTLFFSTSQHQNLEIFVDYHKQPDHSILLTKTAQGHSVYKPLTLKQLSYSHMYMLIHHFQHTQPSFSSGQTCSLLKAWLRFSFPPFLAELLLIIFSCPCCFFIFFPMSTCLLLC